MTPSLNLGSMEKDFHYSIVECNYEISKQSAYTLIPPLKTPIFSRSCAIADFMKKCTTYRYFTESYNI